MSDELDEMDDDDDVSDEELRQMAKDAMRVVAAEQRGRTAAIVCGVLAVVVWAAMAASCIVEKVRVDDRIANSFDISAIQIQQLNGSLAAHVLVAAVIGMACTVPFLFACGMALVDRK